ncbi:MAG: anthranilate phosphoribosyltransferase [Lachnospiraceae bacterium]|nr:anthranilate phosphoribosyltransferase [Lachnospiraceae bacterium]
MIKEAIAKVVNGTNITRDEALSVMDEIMGGEATPAQVGAFLSGLHIKGETVEEIAACAEGMRKFALKVDREGKDVIDIVGTGGDCSNTFNISTAAAFVVSAAGTAVAKHGNRAASSKCGTADCLEALGVNLMVDAEENKEVLNNTNMCFMFAQKYHTAMKYVGPVRKDIGIPTVFNILGPLTNPAENTHQLLGVYSEELVQPIAEALKNLGLKGAMVVYGKDCMDEISLSAPTIVCELKDGEITRYEITPEQFGMKRCEKTALVGGTPEENAQIIKDIFAGKLTGAKRDIVVLNAAAAFHVTKNITIEEGIELANEMIDSGAATRQLDAFIKATNS